jgi:hypothetical protein
MLDSFVKTDSTEIRNERKQKSTRKNCSVEPPLTTPYLMLVCLAKSSALSI